jgi:hypothetical protein
MKRIFLIFLQGFFIVQIVSAQGGFNGNTQTNGIRELSGSPEVYLDCRRVNIFYYISAN